MKTWSLQDAKGRFSEVVQNVQGGEMQIVTKHSKEVAVVLGYETYLELAGRRRSALDSFRSVPELSELDLERDRSPVPVLELP